MLIPVLLFIVGLLCLIKGGDWFVDGATGIARRSMPPRGWGGGATRHRPPLQGAGAAHRCHGGVHRYHPA